MLHFQCGLEKFTLKYSIIMQKQFYTLIVDFIHCCFKFYLLHIMCSGFTIVTIAAFMLHENLSFSTEIKCLFPFSIFNSFISVYEWNNCQNKVSLSAECFLSVGKIVHVVINSVYLC